MRSVSLGENDAMHDGIMIEKCEENLQAASKGGDICSMSGWITAHVRAEFDSNGASKYK